MSGSKPIILSALGLLGPEDLQRLTGASRQRVSGLKKAAGAEGVFWDEPASEEVQEARVLSFPAQGDALGSIGVLSAQKQAQLQREQQDAQAQDTPGELDFVLAERDRFKEAEEKIFKQTGLASYQRNSDLRIYRVTVTDDEGKEKSKLTGSQGVLVDKKQS